MKKIFIIYGHYNDKSFTCAIKDTFIESAKLNGHEVDLADLYQDKFNPIFAGDKANEEIKSYQNRIKKADIIVFIYPIWWFRAPAIVEGFIDRVFIPPWAFQFKKVIGFYGYPIGKLTNKRAIIFNAYGSPRFATVLFFLNLPIRRFKRGFLKICGLKNILYKRFFSVPYISEEKRKKFLEEVKTTAIKL